MMCIYILYSQENWLNIYWNNPNLNLHFHQNNLFTRIFQYTYTEVANKYSLSYKNNNL